MALNINGTTGISGVDGSASAPALQGTDSNTGINFASDTVNINTGGVTRATVDSSGNLNISNGELDVNKSGTGDLFHVQGNGTGAVVAKVENAYNSDNDRFAILELKSGKGSIRFNSNSDSNEGSITYEMASNAMTFGVNSATERMRIDSSGRLLVGTTTNTIGSSGATVVTNFAGNADNGIKTRDSTGSSSVNHMVLISGSTDIGQIIGTTSSVSYSSASDYRLKENVVAISDGISRLKSLKPSRFNFKVTPDETVDGFLAHEVMSIVPQAVSGTKDAVDSDGKPIHQSMDSAKLVPLLTAALQEAVAKIEVLETKVAALEAG